MGVRQALRQLVSVMSCMFHLTADIKAAFAATECGTKEMGG